ncbi:MAG: hypothetical protein B6245_16060 [Desulfobacteraceae bacterium 4572_88]|nr:MAG: hypothetical protein B6245_16060 [Desulfobacteraceae bacterium 4572_88]
MASAVSRFSISWLQRFPGFHPSGENRETDKALITGLPASFSEKNRSILIEIIRIINKFHSAWSIF